MKVKLGVISFLAAAVLIAGCARTVTQIVTYGDQMVVEVTLRGTMEVETNRYFLVLASSSSYKVPLPPPYELVSAPEFIEPWMTPQLGSIEAYFTNFFSTWAGYIVIEPGGFFSVKGPFVQGQTVSREVFASIGEASTKIKFNFSLDRIFGSNIPSTIYFDFIAVDWPADAAKATQDHLTSTNAYISKIFGSTQSIDDPEDDSSDDSLNILKCTVTIQ